MHADGPYSYDISIYRYGMLMVAGFMLILSGLALFALIRREKTVLLRVFFGLAVAIGVYIAAFATLLALTLGGLKNF